MKMTRVLQGAGALALALALQPQAASAWQSGANVGHPYNGTACFTSSAGGATNVCGSDQGWEMPLVVANSSATTYTVVVNTATYMTCGAYSLTWDGVGYDGEAGVYGTGDHSFAGSITVPAYGSLHAWCTVPQNGTVRSIRW